MFVIILVEKSVFFPLQTAKENTGWDRKKDCRTHYAHYEAPTELLYIGSQNANHSFKCIETNLFLTQPCNRDYQVYKVKLLPDTDEIFWHFAPS